jgi:Sortase and related acyltransferases
MVMHDDILDRLNDVGVDSAEPVTVRAATTADTHAIQSIYAPVVTGTFASFEESAPDDAELTHRFLAQPRMPWLVALHAGTVVGYAYASQRRNRPAYRWTADSSVYVSPDYQGRGGRVDSFSLAEGHGAGAPSPPCSSTSLPTTAQAAGAGCSAKASSRLGSHAAGRRRAPGKQC